MLTLNRNQKVGIAGAAVLVSFASGYYVAPAKIKTETRVVEVEKKSNNKDDQTKQNKHKKTTIVSVDRPNGEKDTTTTITEDTDTDKTDKNIGTDVITDKTDTTKSESKSSGVLSISALAGWNFNAPLGQNFTYGLLVQRNIIGPVTVGLWGLTDSAFDNKSCGFSLGVNFQ